MPDLGEDQIPVGYVRRAHGVSGAVVIRPLTDAPALRYVRGAVFLCDGDFDRQLRVQSVRHHNDGLLVQFADINNRNEADALRGVALTIARSERRPLDEGEFWEDQLVGLHVVDTSGGALGKLVAVIAGAAQDRLVIDTGAGENVEVPFVDAIVRGVLVEERRIIIDPPSGLF